MAWLLPAIASYLLFAINGFFDKFLLSKLLPDSKAYTFLVGVLSIFALCIAPWFLLWPGWGWLMIDLIAGAIFLLAVYCFFSALQKGEIIRTAVFIGGISSIFLALFSIFFIEDGFSIERCLGLLVLIIGIFLTISISGKKGYAAFLSLRPHLDNGWKKIMPWGLASGFIFALFTIASRYVYSEQDFLSSFIWIRLGSFLMALLFLIRGKDRRELALSLRGSKKLKFTLDNDTNKLVIFSQSLGAMAALLQSYAFSIGSIAVISSLQGIQYIFLLPLVIAASWLVPSVFKEKGVPPVLWQKFTAIAVIALGLYLANS